MVAASATAILKAIDLSNTFRCPFENSQNPDQNPQWQISHQFLTARVNRTLSTPGSGRVLRQEQRKCSEQSK
jgi:hypothetical protein